jgi:hypothetical protein
MGRPYTCPYCHESGQSVSKGVRRTKTMGDRRLRKCKACGRKFTPKNQKPGTDDSVATTPAPVVGAAQEVTPATTDAQPVTEPKPEAANVPQV